MLYKLLTCCLIIINLVSFSQTHQSANASLNKKAQKQTKLLPPPCGTDDLLNRLRQKDPVYQQKLDLQNQIVQAQIARGLGNRAVVSIPVVFHVIHRGEALGVGSNISDAQVLSCLDAMNRDFRRTGADGGISNSGPSGVDTEIEFCIAQRDPSGNPTSGINRVNGNSVTGYAADGIGGGGSGNEVAVKALSNWDNQSYYNIWIVAEIDGQGNIVDDPGYGGGTQGYAYLPVGGSVPSPTIDGCVIVFHAAGNDPGGATGHTLWSATRLGRTLSHEVGHSLFLYHTFEGGSCSETNCTTDGDQVCDTPPTTVGTGNNCANPQCGGVENKENYMQYQNNSCASDFTQGQKDRMLAVLNGSRNQLINTSNCLAPFPINAYLKEIISPNDSSCTNNITGKAVICNGGTNNITSMDVIYNIDGLTPQTYNWTGNLTPGNCDTITFNMITTTNGNHIFNALIDTTNVNGAADGYTGDNAKANPFYSINGNGILIELTTDCRADDIGWIITDSTGAIRASGGGYSPGIQTILDESCLDSGCFKFKIVDAQGNGLKKTGACPSDGTYTITDLNTGLTIAQLGSNPDFGDSAVHEFCLPFVPSITTNFNGCDTIYIGSSISFNDSSIGVPSITSWNWDFGGTGSSALQNPTHTFSSVGSYNIKLVTSNGSVTDSLITNGCVVVEPLPPGYCDTLQNYTVSDTLVSFNITGSWGYYPGHGGANLVGFAEPFNLPAATNSIQKVMLPVYKAHSGSATSSFTLNVYDDNAGQPGTILSSDTILISSLTAGITNEIALSYSPILSGDFWVGFEIDYQNGDTLAVLSSQHRYTGTGTTYSKAGSAWLSTNFLTNLNTSMGLKVVFTDVPAIGTVNVTNSKICAGQSVTFNASSVQDYDTLKWYFPGGTPSTSNNLSQAVTYNTPGTYTAILYLENICAKDSIRQTITVDGSAPTAAFTENTTTICEQDTIRFNATSSIGSNLITSWTINGGTPSISNKTIDSALYNTPGTFVLKLKTQNGCGADSVTKSITINPYPRNSISPRDTIICGGESVALQANGGTIYSWEDGSTNAINTLTPDTTMRIWVTSSSGVCRGDTAYSDISVNPLPKIVPNTSQDTACLGSIISFSINGSSAITYNWNFGDNNTTAIPNPTHVYASEGTFSVTLEGTYGLCTNDSTINVVVASCVNTEELFLDRNIGVYPNPSSGIFNIELKANINDELEIKLFNQTGKLLMSQNINNAKVGNYPVNISDYSKGIYILTITTAKASINKKLIVTE